MNKHIGRNDPCHCGSGKKYKKCCFLKINKAEIKNLEYTRFHGKRMSTKDKLVEKARNEIGISDSEVLSFLSDSPLYKNRDVDKFYYRDEHFLFFNITINDYKMFAYPIKSENVFLWEYCLTNFPDFFDTTEIRYLESIKKSIAGFFQIKEIDRNSFITTVEDIFTFKTYKIKDKKLSQIAVRHDIYGGFLIPYDAIQQKKKNKEKGIESIFSNLSIGELKGFLLKEFEKNSSLKDYFAIYFSDKSTKKRSPYILSEYYKDLSKRFPKKYFEAYKELIIPFAGGNMGEPTIRKLLSI